MLWLVLAALLWLAIHLGLSGTRLRDQLASITGGGGFAAVFSVLAAAAMAGLIYAYRRADTVAIWYPPPWLVGLVDIAMLLALVLFVASLIPPRYVGEGPRGMFRVTRHPMLCAFAIWSGAHIAANGDLASLIFFGTFLLTVLAGMPSIDAKLARRDPTKAAALHGATSRMPFAAILGGRNQLVLSEIGWLAPVVGLIAWLVVLFLHPLLLGVSALPQ